MTVVSALLKPHKIGTTTGRMFGKDGDSPLALLRVME